MLGIFFVTVNLVYQEMDIDGETEGFPKNSGGGGGYKNGED